MKKILAIALAACFLSCNNGEGGAVDDGRTPFDKEIVPDTPGMSETDTSIREDRVDIEKRGDTAQ